MDSSPSIASLAASLVKAQLKIQPISMDKSVSYQNIKFEYASLSNIIANLRPILAAEGLAVVQVPSLYYDAGAKFIRITTLIMHSSGEFIQGELSMECSSADPKQVGAIISYGRRYAYGSMLCVALDGDYDAEVIGELYLGTPDQKKWLKDTLAPMGVTTNDGLRKVSEAMIKMKAEATREYAIDAMEQI